MRNRSVLSTVLLFSSLFILTCLPSFAQNRLPQTIPADSARGTVPNTVVSKAKAATDLGAAPANQQLESLSLRFSMSSAQSAALDLLLANQQNPSSAQYHQWLTPEQFASQFGLSGADLASVSEWLQAQGFTVTGPARGGTFIQFSGTVGQVDQAFGITLHSVSLNGEKHISNLADPSLPVDLANIVSGMTGLNDFHPKPHIVGRHVPAKADLYGGSTYGNLIAPGDFYTIYDLKPLLNASTPINGTGISVAVAGQVDINTGDVQQFRTAASLSSNLPQTTLYGSNPGAPTESSCNSNNPPDSCGDLYESTLDVEWAGATAPSASIHFITGPDVFANSMTGAIDNDVAPIVTVSYGDCETGFGSSDIAQYNALFKQANAQGQTVLGPAGDSGAADCDYSTTYATHGLAVDFPASSPYVTAVGGTMFNENGGTYWNTTSGANAGTALSYIPEQPWNEFFYSSGNGIEGLNDGGGGGGVSQVFSKPSWQVGSGVPADASRDVPDIAFNAGANHDGYVVCVFSSCTNGFADSQGGYFVFGGTSVPTPSFAGILALLEQKVGSKLGNVNPTIYGLANSTYYSTVFHDVTSGTNAAPCTVGSTDCNAGSPNYFAPGTLTCPANSCSVTVGYSAIGYLAATGYDLTTGWGSMDIANMVNDWLLVTPTGGTTTSTLAPSTTTATAASGTNSVTITAVVSSGSSSVSTTPTGTVTLLVDNVATSSTATLTGGTATFAAYSTVNLSAGTHVFTASYAGDSVYAGSKGSTDVNVTSTTSADFSLTPSTNTTISVAAGGTAAGVTYTVTPANGFVGNVTFTATTTASSLNATYAFSVSPVVISSTTAGTTVFTLEAYASANGDAKTGLLRRGAQAAANASGRSSPWLLGGSSAALAGLICFGLTSRRRRGWTALLVALMTVAVFSIAGCGSGTSAAANENAAPGTYSITIVATGVNAAGTTVTHTAPVTFVVTN